MEILPPPPPPIIQIFEILEITQEDSYPFTYCHPCSQEVFLVCILELTVLQQKCHGNCKPQICDCKTRMVSLPLHTSRAATVTGLCTSLNSLVSTNFILFKSHAFLLFVYKLYANAKKSTEICEMN